MTKTLTEQWKNGELGFGYYYIDFGIGGVPMLFNGLEFYCERTQKPNAIKTILAPVPSYEKVKEMSQKIECLEFDNEALEMAHNEGKEINVELSSKNEQLEKKLKIATKALKEYADKDKWEHCSPDWRDAEEALKEMEGVK